jgi:hypothetical protein
MTYQKISGVIKTIDGREGKARDRSDRLWRFSMLEIGDRFLEGVVVNERLVPFLNPGEECDLWLDGKRLVALGRSDNILLIPNFARYSFPSLIISLVCIPFFGLGLLMLLDLHRSNNRYDLIETQIVPQYSRYQSLGI